MYEESVYNPKIITSIDFSFLVISCHNYEMDSRFSGQDLLRCDLCDDPVPPMHCDLCKVNLCKDCVVEHISDVSTEHKVVSFKQRGSAPKNPKCSQHATNHCELYCEECDSPVCALCISSNSHMGHTVRNLLEILNLKRETIEKDYKEIQSVFARYEERVSVIEREKSSLEGDCEKLTTAITNQGKALHREVDVIVTNRNSYIEETKNKTMEVLNKQQYEITQIVSELEQILFELRKMLDTNDVNIVSTYKSKYTEFKSLPPKVHVTLPSFSPKKINVEQIANLFGSLSSIKIGDDGHTMKTPEAVSSPDVKSLLKEPRLITTIDFGDRYLPIACLSDEEFWTCGNGKVMNLRNLQGRLLK